jgi:anaerobic magnesium-protoporphyrin IX monomethyl ester cyclase
MRICICTTPIRPIPTTFPPFGSMAIIQSLRGIGEDVSFFNIDYFRYKHEQVEQYFREQQFDVVGISAVVSTAYAYTKYLSKLIRAVSPDAIIVLGGNLAASAEILMRKCEIDLCVAGDGEFVIRDLIKVLGEKPLDYSRLKATKGIAFIDENDRFCFTGYGAKPAAGEIPWPDYDILAADGSLPYFISEIIDKRLEGHGREQGAGERLATVNLTKGCVARCTFCHRWEKGFRTRPVDQAIAHIKMLKEEHHVSFVDVCDENFGADPEITNELVSRLGELNVTWRCAGVRARSVSLEMLKHWKKNGCVTANYGVESGSQTMLNIMEKNTTVEQNINALIWASEAGLNTVVQLVLGMPGETDDTIRETIEFLKKVSGSLQRWSGKAPSDLISVNYAQALPGTPLYEWAREHGYIGKTIDEEEKYLLRISDTDAYSEDHFINYTGLPMLRVLMWRPWIYAEIDYNNLADHDRKHLSLLQIARYYLGVVRDRLEKRRQNGTESRFSKLVRLLIGGKLHADAAVAEYDYVSDSGYFNVSNSIKFAPLLLNPLTRRNFFALLAIAMALRKGGSALGTMRLMGEYFVWAISGGKRRGPPVEPKSLRKVVKILPANPQLAGIDPMIPLRKGR